MGCSGGSADGISYGEVSSEGYEKGADAGLLGVGADYVAVVAAALRSHTLRHWLWPRRMYVR